MFKTDTRSVFNPKHSPLVCVLLFIIQLCSPWLGTEGSFRSAWLAGNIEFKQNNGGINGRLEFKKGLSWSYVSFNKETYEKIETEALTLVERTESSLKFCSVDQVHLRHIEANVEKGVVYVVPRNSNRRITHNILDVAPGLIHGWTLGSVVFGCHQLKQLNNFRWVMINPESKQELQLIEKSRDDWSVHLVDEKSEFRVEVDYHTKYVKTFWLTNETKSTKRAEIKISGADYNKDAMNYFWFRLNDLPAEVAQCEFRPKAADAEQADCSCNYGWCPTNTCDNCLLVFGPNGSQRACHYQWTERDCPKENGYVWCGASTPTPDPTDCSCNEVGCPTGKCTGCLQIVGSRRTCNSQWPESHCPQQSGYIWCGASAPTPDPTSQSTDCSCNEAGCRTGRCTGCLQVVGSRRTCNSQWTENLCPKQSGYIWCGAPTP